MRLNFCQSETTWVLCLQESLEIGASPNIILVEDPPTFVMGGKTFSRDIKLSKPLVGGKGWGK